MKVKITKGQCGNCGYKGKLKYSFDLCGFVCPKCGKIIMPDWLLMKFECVKPMYEVDSS